MCKMLNIGLASSAEICRELGKRLKAARLVKGLLAAELAARAGISRGTLATLENSGKGTLDTLVRVACTLDMQDDLAEVFTLKVRSIADMERNEQAQRKRASRKRTSLPGAAQ